MSFDLVTLNLLATLLAAMLGLLLVYFGRLQNMAAMGWWGTAYLMGAAAIAIWTSLDHTLGPLALLLPTALGIAATGLMWTAARVFHGRKPHWPGLGLGIGVWVAAFMAVPDSQPSLRITIGAAILSTFVGLGAGELWSERRRVFQRRWPALAMPVLHGGVLILPIAIGQIFDPAHLAAGYSIWTFLFALELVLYAIGTMFVIVILVSERTVNAHERAAMTDPLTGLLNRRGFLTAAEKMIANETAAGRAVTLLAFDLDKFKTINDRFGHQAGDEVLQLFATYMTATLRATDLSARFGGEEFVALLPCSVSDAIIAAQRLREAFGSSGVYIDDQAVATTVSIGAAGYIAGKTWEQMLAAADVALYRAKAEGRDRLVIATAAMWPVDQPTADKPARAITVTRGVPLAPRSAL